MTAKIRLTVMKMNTGKIGKLSMASNAKVITKNTLRALGSVSYNVRDLIEAGGTIDVVGGHGPEGSFMDRLSNTSGLVSYTLEYSQNKTTHELQLR